MSGHTSIGAKHDAINLDDGLRELAARFSGTTDAFAPDGAAAVDIGIFGAPPRGGVAIVTPGMAIATIREVATRFKLSAKQLKLLEAVIASALGWRRASFPVMEENYAASGFISGGRVPGTSGDIVTTSLSNGTASAAAELSDDGSYRPDAMKHWIRNWQAKRALRPVPAGSRFLRIRMSMDAELFHPWSSARATHYSAFGTVLVSRGPGAPFTPAGPSAFPVSVDSPSQAAFPIESGYTDFVCQVPVAPGERPVVQLILGIIVGVQQGRVSLLISATKGLDPRSWTRCRFGYAASVRVADVVAVKAFS